MSISVKICGLTSYEAVDAAIKAEAAYGGLVFHKNSPRFVAPDMAGGLAARMRGRLKIVALIADLDNAAIEAVVGAAHPDFLQLHGGESVARTADIGGRFGLKVIKALPVAETADLAMVRSFEPVADMLLFDARPPPGAERAGGHGAAFDWKILCGTAIMRPWFLAGGLTPVNVARAIALSGAKLVDVSSGVESALGIKSAAAILEFAAAAREKVGA